MRLLVAGSRCAEFNGESRLVRTSAYITPCYMTLSSTFFGGLPFAPIRWNRRRACPERRRRGLNLEPFATRCPCQPVSRRVGEPTTGSNFREERGRGAAKCRRYRSKTRQFRSLGFSGEANMAPSAARESTLHCKLGSQLHRAAVRSVFWLDGKRITEIPVYRYVRL